MQHPDPTRPHKTFIFDLETTGLLTRFDPDVDTRLGISEFALKEVGKPSIYRKYTDILSGPVGQLDAGQITAAKYAEIIQATNPTSVRWQQGLLVPGGVLNQVHQRHVAATRSALAGKADVLAKESKLVSLMTRHLRQGHKVKGWNVGFDMTMMSAVAARSSPAVHQRWQRALNVAVNRGQIEDMSTGVKKFMYLAAQDSAMQGKMSSKEFFTLGQVDKNLVKMAKQGKLTVDEIDKLSYDKIIEEHAGFKKFFRKRLDRTGKADMSFERYMAWLQKKTDWADSVQSFATGQRYPNIRAVKGWSADILLRTLAPEGIKGSTLEARASEIAGRTGMAAHEAASDVVYEEILDDIFRTKSKTWDAAWGDIQPRLKAYGIHSQEQFFQRYRSAIEWKSKSQLKEHALESVRRTDPTWMRQMSEKLIPARTVPQKVAAGSRARGDSLKKIYGEALSEVSDKWRMFSRTHPRLALLAQLGAAAVVADAAFTQERPDPGIRSSHPPNRNIDGIYFGSVGGGVARGLTDFGSGRRQGNDTTRGFAELSAYRASLAYKYPSRYGVSFDTLEKNYDTWNSARFSADRDILSREEYKVVKGAQAKTRGLNRSAWVGIMDLDHYKVKVEDADTVTIQRRGLLGMLHKPVSIRLAGIDAPEVEHGGADSILHEDQFAGKEASQYFEELLEKQQSLRLVVDPSARTYNRNVGVLVGDRGANLNLQLVRAGAAAALPAWRGRRQIVDDNIFAEAEAKAASTGRGMWMSKGWQMHRAIGMIAGERVTNTTLNSLKRITDSQALMGWYGLVQNAHDDANVHWTPQEMVRMHQVGAAYRAENMSAVNYRTKEIGSLQGIRRPHSMWGIAGHGINPSQLQGANVSDFGSGRSQFTQAQLAQNEKLMNTVLGGRAGPSKPRSASFNTDLLRGYLKKSGTSMAEFQTGYGRDVLNLFQTAQDTSAAGNAVRPFDFVQDALSLNPTVRTRSDAALGNLRQASRRVYGHGMYDMNVEEIIQAGLDRDYNTLVEYAGAKPSGRMHQLQRERREYKAAEMQLEAWDVQRKNSLHQRFIKRPTHERTVLPEFMRREAPTPKPAPSFRAKVRMAHPAPIPVPQAVKTSTREVAEVVEAPLAGVTKRAHQHLAHGRGGLSLALGVGTAILAGLGIGALIADRRRDEETTGAMLGPRTFSPGEFVAMKSSPSFPSSSKQIAWADHEAMGDAGGNKKLAVAHLAVGLLHDTFGQSPHLEAWNYFHKAESLAGKGIQFGVSADRTKSLVNQSGERIYKALKKEGFTQAEIREWTKATKFNKGFINKIMAKDIGGTWYDKLFKRVGDSWSAIEDSLGNILDTLAPKSSKLGEDFAGNVKRWFEGLSTKVKSAGSGQALYEKIEAFANKFVPKDTRPLFRANSFARDKASFKYLWKNLVKNPKTFTAKVAGATEILANLGNMEKIKVAHQAKLLKIAPHRLTERKNFLTSMGQRMKVYMRRSEFFTSKFSKASAKITKWGNKLKAAGATKWGRIAGKVPLANVAFGVLEGAEMMDQYENSYKGFAIESAAGTVGNAVEWAIMKQAWSMGARGAVWGAEAGAAIGAWFGGVGAIPGAAIGAVVGAVVAAAGTVAVGLIAGQVARGAVRMGGRALLGARMKRTAPVNIPANPYAMYQGSEFPMIRGSTRNLTQFHGMDPARPDMTPFGGAYNPIKGQDIDSRTLQMANKRRKITRSPRDPRPISQFTPTFGLVNVVLWNQRRGSKIRSVVERGASHHRLPRRHANASRMRAHAA